MNTNDVSGVRQEGKEAAAAEVTRWESAAVQTHLGVWLKFKTGGRVVTYELLGRQTSRTVGVQQDRSYSS